jgi:signal transduction histidine kinase
MTALPNTVLVVDDDRAGRYLKSHLLRKAGYTTYEAPNGALALACCRALSPDPVLLDVRLPDANGVDLCREIKSEFPDTAVLQTSAAVTSGHDRAIALEGGADSFLVEPIEPEELLATAKALVRMRQAEQALRGLNETLENLVADRTRELTEANRLLQVEIAERRKAEDALWHAQKMEAIGQLTGGVAHDFNNLLAVVVGTLEVVRSAVETNREVPRAKLLRLLNAAEVATERGSRLTQQLLVFARRGTLRSETATLSDLFRISEPLFRRALGEAIPLTLVLPPDLWPCRVDVGQFEAAILNLLVNARDAMEGGGSVAINAANIIIDPSDTALADELTPGCYIVVSVTDSGVGMTPDVVARAFEPFFTTKEVGKGTGLGLSQVYGFVKQSGGHITIESAPGAGTTVQLYLARANAVDTPAAKQQKDVQTANDQSETVLVVEDNDEVREMAIATISDLGYRVLTARNGPAALDLLHKDERIDLLFSDVVMPGGMNGYELIRKARTVRHDLKALVTSGYANDARKDGVPIDVPLLQKPYHRAELADQIRAALSHH